MITLNNESKDNISFLDTDNNSDIKFSNVKLVLHISQEGDIKPEFRRKEIGDSVV
jgi:hypothetical protein